MKIIGLTGGIASGKSTVSKMLKKLGAAVIDADRIARMVVEPGQQALENIVNQFGNGVLFSDGTLDRKALGKIVFGEPEKIKILNEITHPEIRKLICRYIDDIKSSTMHKVVIIDAALLLESGMNELADEVWLVYVDYDTQVKRLMKRDNITAAEADARIKTQMPVEDKIKQSDRIIDNTKDIIYTEQQIEKLWCGIID